MGIEERAAKAIADYEAVKGAKQQRVKDKRLQWLGEVEHESVTAYLEKALVKAGVGPHAAPLLRAISKVSRPSLEKRIWAILHDKEAHASTRRWAAVALMSIGKRTADKLIRMLRRGSEAAKEPVRVAVIHAIIGSGDKRVIRGLAHLFDQGTSEDKLKYLRMLESVQGIPAVSTARIKMISRGSLMLAAVAWRQLALEKDARARDLAIDVLERMPQGPSPAVAAELVVGIAVVRDADLYPLLLRYGAISNSAIKKAMQRAAPLAAKDMDLMRYLAQHGLKDDRPGVRDVALVLLKHAPAETVQPLVQKVRRALRRPKKESLDLAVGLHDLLSKDPTWVKDVLKLAISERAEVRTVGLSLLIDLECDEAITYAQRSLGAKSWELRTAAIRYLTKFRDVSSIPLLIGRFGKEDGRLHAEVGNALFVHTGTRCWKRGEWDAWWRKKRSGFVLPHEDTVKSGMGGIAGQTSAYHGIPLVSKRVAFLIDISGSMGARIGSGRKHTRLDLAKDELTKALGNMPADHRVNLIPYSSGVRPLWKELQLADKVAREQILKQIKKLRPTGGTNIYGALEVAFRDRNVDTIYLLTDGEPSAGAIVNPNDIADEIYRWNHLRQIVIHCIGLGIDSALLKDLAEGSGGVYTFVR